jgi:hypothetical protein
LVNPHVRKHHPIKFSIEGARSTIRAAMIVNGNPRSLDRALPPEFPDPSRAELHRELIIPAGLPNFIRAM